MSEMVERILKVFDEKKLLGRQDTWGLGQANGKFVLYPGCYICGMGALLLDVSYEEPDDDIDDYEAAAVKYLGLNEGYVEGYIAGFDGSEPAPDPTNAFAEGFEDGRSTWNALKKRNRVYVSQEEIDRETAEPDYDNGPQG